MMGDAFGTQDDPSVPEQRISAQRCGPDLVAPVTLGRPRWRNRHDRSARAVAALALGSAPVFALLWRDAVTQPLPAAALSAAIFALVGYWALRCRLWQLRRSGRAMSTILAVGTVDDVATLVARTRRRPRVGWRVDGACTSTGAGRAGASSIAGVPVIGDLDSVAAQALSGPFDAVSVGPTPGWTSARLQQLAFDLDGSSTALLVDPRLVPFAGPHMHVTRVDGLPLLRLEHPSLRGVRRLLKGLVDRLVALLALVVVAPVLLACVVAVRRDGGPALRRRRRVGRGGREFMLLTFRTMDAAGDPTRVGRVLRRHCLDELPQLLNVLGGSMSLVGPRPVTPADPYLGGGAGRQRMLVKPGITGLGQADEPSNGAGSPPDLRYVTQWTPALDARILARTVRAVLSGATADRPEL